MKKILKQYLKQVPGVLRTVRFIKRQKEKIYLKGKNTEEIFAEIYRINKWGYRHSFSGPGSDPEQTRAIAREIPILLKEVQASSILDIPCGDFHWMKTVDLEGVHYLGADIVAELIEENKRYENDHIKFTRLDIIRDCLPKAEMIFVRDCLVHLSNEDIFKSLRNIYRSGSKYLLTTTFNKRNKNIDIATGQWRVLNLQLPPFNFPKPLKLINEGCTEEEGEYSDKCLGLWKISDSMVING